MKRRQVIRFSIIFICITIACYMAISLLSNDKREGPKAKEGVINLENWSFVENGPVNLYGEWDFYWNEHVHPQQGYSPINGKSVIKIPSQWSEEDRLSNKGYATYKLTISNIPEARNYAMEIYKIPSAYRVFINGKEIASSGKVGKNIVEEIPQYGPNYFSFHLREYDHVEITIHTSNYHYRSGGIRGVIKIGTADQILAGKEERVAYQLAMVGGLLLLGLYHLGIFIYRRKELSALFFGLLCLSMALRTLLVGETYFSEIFPNFPWELQIKLLYLSLYALLPFFIWFFYHLAKEQVSLKSSHVLSTISLVFCIVVVVTPVDIFTNTMKTFYLFILFLIIYFMSHIFKAVAKGKPGFMFLSLSSVFLSYAVVRDIIYYRKEMQDGELTSLGLVIIVIGLAFVNSGRLAQTFTKIEQAQRKLKQWNEQLENEVAERTKELTNANKRLQQLSFLDGLTNIPNRRLFNETYNEVWLEAVAKEKELSLLMIDIDDFKQLNDTYGHLFGDECLKKVAKLLEEKTTSNEKFIARYGGEEFVIILKDDSLNKAEAFAHSCLQEIRKITNIDRERVSITVSIGVATIRAHQSINEETLIAMADNALYTAKRNGKNRVEVYLNNDGQHQEGSADK